MLCLKVITDALKYPLLSKVIKALLSLPHGNADTERGFRENRHLPHGRSSLNIASINGMRHVKSFLQRYNRDATKVPPNPDLLKSVRQARAKHARRLSLEESSSKRKATEDPVVEQPNHEAAKAALEDQVAASKALLTSTEDTINLGVKEKDIH